MDVTVLDCTLRDGSYVVHHQFTTEDTSRICALLESGGIKKIEIGHGLGMGASDTESGRAAATDEEYLWAAARTLKSAQFGMFCIPGIAKIDHLNMARACGAHFVRVGTNVDQVAEAKPYIEHARKLGLTVMYNAMKSYVVSPARLLAIMQDAVAWGAQAVYVVDSAGTLIPPQIKSYFEPLVDALTVPVGFHGHNNLLMANANCLAAWEAGGKLFDGTLQGIGRSGGNAQTEILAHVFERMNVKTGLDVMKLLEGGDRLVRPFMATDASGATALNFVLGLAGFHSSHLARVEPVANRHGIPVTDLIVAVSRLDRSDPSPALIEKVAGDISARKKRR